jgi:tripartite-type tricarboxylate transporter receptor subunit TctC
MEFGLNAALAQDSAWPQRSVKLVVPYSPGGSADTLGRMASTGLTDAFKQPFVIDNKGGAGGVIGSQIVQKSAPDGYTLVVSGIGSHVIAPADNPSAFDPIKDFSHIAILGGPPLALAVNAKVPVNDLKGFIEYCKSTQGGISSHGRFGCRANSCFIYHAHHGQSAHSSGSFEGDCSDLQQTPQGVSPRAHFC